MKDWERVELSPEVRQQVLERSRTGRRSDDLIEGFVQAHGLSRFVVRLYVAFGSKEDAFLMYRRSEPPPEPLEGRE
jgi:hypothetical protein